MQSSETFEKWQTDKNYRKAVVRELEQKYGPMSGEEFHLIVD